MKQEKFPLSTLELEKLLCESRVGKNLTAELIINEPNAEDGFNFFLAFEGFVNRATGDVNLRGLFSDDIVKKFISKYITLIMNENSHVIYNQPLSVHCIESQFISIHGYYTLLNLVLGVVVGKFLGMEKKMKDLSV